MKFEFGEYEFDLGKKCNKIEMVLPFGLLEKTNCDILITIEQIKDGDLLGMYSCGDLLSSGGIGLAGSECKKAVTHKITIKIVVSGGLPSEFIALSCQEHSLMLTHQMLFFLGLQFGKEIQTWDNLGKLDNNDDKPEDIDEFDDEDEDEN